LDLLKRSAIWYLRELDAAGSGDLTAADALVLLYQDQLVRQKTRDVIRASCVAWSNSLRKLIDSQASIAAGNWGKWLRANLLYLRIWMYLEWLQFGPPVRQVKTLQRLIEMSERLAHLSGQ